MLAELKVRELVLIEKLDIELSAGFNVLSGETGTGKSLVATAMDLLLGRRGDANLVRRGAAEAEVEGLFDISDEPEVKARLAEAGLPAEDELLIRRVIPAEGRHRCYVNCRLASLGTLARMADGLAQVMGQHEHHFLLDPARQLELLDGFGGLWAERERMAELFRRAEAAATEVERLRRHQHDRASRLDYIAFQLKEIERLDPTPDEMGELDIEIKRLRHQEQLVSTARLAAEVLYERDGAVFEQLSATLRDLDAQREHDPALDEVAASLGEAVALVEEASRFLSGYGRRIESDPARLATAEDRREELALLCRKHGTDVRGVLALRDALAAELSTLENYEEALKAAGEALTDGRREAEAFALGLTRARTKAGRRLGKAVTAELADLSFRGGKLEVSLEQRPDGLGPAGGDRVELLVALNPGEGTHPLRRVASGGELSRLMLAIKRALSGVGPVGTYIFDEVDAGIGGAVAAAVGRKLKDVAAHHQVVCITHLPQIAGMADTHFKVDKEDRRGRTATRVDRLTGEARVAELARMIGGAKVTDKTRAAARELLADEEGRCTGK